jgi:hypothetical protein
MSDNEVWPDSVTTPEHRGAVFTVTLSTMLLLAH